MALAPARLRWCHTTHTNGPRATTCPRCHHLDGPKSSAKPASRATWRAVGGAAVGSERSSSTPRRRSSASASASFASVGKPSSGGPIARTFPRSVKTTSSFDGWCIVAATRPRPARAPATRRKTKVSSFRSPNGRRVRRRRPRRPRRRRNPRAPPRVSRRRTIGTPRTVRRRWPRRSRGPRRAGVEARALRARRARRSLRALLAAAIDEHPKRIPARREDRLRARVRRRDLVPSVRIRLGCFRPRRVIPTPRPRRDVADDHRGGGETCGAPR